MSIDLRTRIDSDQAPVTADRFFNETLPDRLDAHQDLVAAGGKQLRLHDLCLEIDGEAWTLSWHGDRAAVDVGNQGQARARLTHEQLTDIVNDQSTPVALMSNRLLDMPEGGLPDFLDWWLVMRAALDGRKVHVAGDVEFETEPRRSFSIDDSDEDMRRFLEDAGYLHIQGLFSEAEMAAVEADFAKAAPHYRKGDDQAWFGTSHDGEEHLVRMEGFDRYSDVAAELIEEDRFLRIGRIPGCSHKLAAKPGQRIGALTKPIGIVKGISDVPWHKDCSLGRHSYECCSLTVGISVTGADAESGQLRVVPGTHRALVWPAPCIQPGLDLEPIDLPTRTGDVTVHLSCTQHMSQPPVARTRKVLYTSFNQVAPDAEQAAANRARLGAVRSKTHSSVSQFPGHRAD